MEQDMIFRVPMLFLGKERFTSSTSQCLCNNLNMLAKQYKVDARRAEWARRRQGPYGHTSSQLDELVHNKLKLYSLQKPYLNNIVPLSLTIQFSASRWDSFLPFPNKVPKQFWRENSNYAVLYKTPFNWRKERKSIQIHPCFVPIFERIFKRNFSSRCCKDNLEKVSWSKASLWSCVKD